MHKIFCSRIFLLVLSAFLVSSCAIVKPISFQGVNSFNIAENSGKGLQLVTSLKLFNPNRVAVSLNRTDIDVFVDDTYIGKLLSSDKISIPGKQSFDAEFTITISFANLLAVGRNVLTQIKNGSFRVTFKGELDAQYRNYNKTFQINTTRQVNL